MLVIKTEFEVGKITWPIKLCHIVYKLSRTKKILSILTAMTKESLKILIFKELCIEMLYSNDIHLHSEFLSKKLRMSPKTFVICYQIVQQIPQTLNLSSSKMLSTKWGGSYQKQSMCPNILPEYRTLSLGL